MATIYLSNGKPVQVDDEDVPLLAGTWHEHRGAYTTYARGAKDKRLMHRVITGAARGVDVDHENGNGLDNRRLNLRQATRADNSHNRKSNRNNTSGVKGVSWDKRARKWRARVMLNHVSVNVGFFESIDQARAAIRVERVKLHGAFTNHGDCP